MKLVSSDYLPVGQQKGRILFCSCNACLHLAARDTVFMDQAAVRSDKWMARLASQNIESALLPRKP